MIGSGYVGLVSGACLADFGHVVTCIDTDSAKTDALRRGAMPIYEPGLSDLLAVRAADDCVKTILKRPVLVDLRNIDTPPAFRALMSRFGPHAVIHLAAQAGVRY